jgi:hypothetical protein
MTALSRTAQLEHRLSNIARKHRQTTEQIETAVLHKASIALTAASFGALARNSISAEIKGVPWKLPLALIAQTIAAVSSGAISTIAGGIADASMAVYTANAIATKNWVAGETDAAGNL